jgi:SAM-dependent methyltransferase
VPGVRSYDVTAEFYDVLQAADHLRRAERLLDRWLGSPRVGALDIGAGTGLATRLLAQRTSVTVHAVEPSAGMRAVLLSRLARHTELLSHVRVHAQPMERLGLADVADFALCLNTMGLLDSSDRRAALIAIARAVVPGGTLVVQRPPDRAGPDIRALPSWELGGDMYGGEVVASPAGEGEIDWRFDYRVTRSGVVVREESETFHGYLVSAPAFDAELSDAGFALVDRDAPDVVVARVLRS